MEKAFVKISNRIEGFFTKCRFVTLMHSPFALPHLPLCPLPLSETFFWSAGLNNQLKTYRMHISERHFCIDFLFFNSAMDFVENSIPCLHDKTFYVLNMSWKKKGVGQTWLLIITADIFFQPQHKLQSSASDSFKNRFWSWALEKKNQDHQGVEGICCGINCRCGDTIQ